MSKEGYLRPHLLPPDAVDPITTKIPNVVPLSLQRAFRERGNFRFLADSGVNLMAALSWHHWPAFYKYGKLLKTYSYASSEVALSPALQAKKNVHVIDLPLGESQGDNLLIFVHGGAWGSGKPLYYRLCAARLGFVMKCKRIALVEYPVFPEAGIQLQSSHKLVDVFVGLAGVYDVVKHYYWERERGAHIISPMTSAAWRDNGRPFIASPTRLVKTSSLISLQEFFPRTVLLHGTEDKTVPYTSSLAFLQALQAKGVRAEGLWLREIGHMEPVIELTEGKESLPTVHALLALQQQLLQKEEGEKKAVAAGLPRSRL